VSPESLRFDASGLIPAVVQDAETGDVLMVAWMNAEALERTLATRLAHFWSRSRRALWQKGETSGHRQHVDAVYADCDGDTLLVLAHSDGAACHTGSRTCFFTRVGEPAAAPASLPPAPAAGPAILDALERVIQSRRASPHEGSYVAGLLAAGDARIAQKVGEEAAEVVVAALAEGSERLVAEVADLWFHTLVLLGARGLSARHVFAELSRRHRPAAGAIATVPAPED
jgi:phosphoribosyl-ATP pyrophosphohydrolase/phosphoribosyl-AMP cyclohydrolase